MPIFVEPDIGVRHSNCTLSLFVPAENRGGDGNQFSNELAFVDQVGPNSILLAVWWQIGEHIVGRDGPPTPFQMRDSHPSSSVLNGVTRAVANLDETTIFA